MNDPVLDDQLLSELRTLALRPDPAPLAPVDRARLEAAVVEAVVGAAGPRRSWRDVAPAALVAACLLAVLGLVAVPFVTSRPDTRPAALPVRAEPAAARALQGLATVALASTTPRVGADDFVYVRSTVISNEGAYGEGVELGAPHEREIWLSQQERPAASGLIREFGQDWPLSGAGRASAPGPDRPTYAWIDDLPTDPDRIVAELESRQPFGSEQSPEQYAFDRIGDIVTENLVPPELASALFEAVTRLDGVRLIDDVQDAIGRRGFGIARTDERFGTTTVWVFEPGSAVPLGVRWYLPGPSSDPQAMTLFGATAIQERGVASELGVAPGESADALT
ncbi:CU044_5270 family protein [Nocardioides flavescens]|uniref:CU044_5270 family protein n=1 Tax=Nocardioides flavescens TaxID=2691959 RepID=A0A6L7EV26_9ACTN|nr:CU044_5270 family protein [Nocardioides flavescens]MXG90560.1 hypothetical protein [Nocardioides flavescens]